MIEIKHSPECTVSQPDFKLKTIWSEDFQCDIVDMNAPSRCTCDFMHRMINHFTSQTHTPIPIGVLEFPTMSDKHHHHHKHPAAAIALGMTTIALNFGAKTMQVNLTWTTPAFRADGVTPLTLPEIQTTNLFRNDTLLANPVAVVGTNTFTDTTPLTGNDVYSIETVTTDGLVSKLSNLAAIVVPNANPAAAITDLAGTLITP